MREFYLLFQYTFYFFLNKIENIFRRQRTSKKLLIIRIDAIGDFIIFRNFIREIASSEKYKSYSITLLGNIVWKDIAEELDGQFIKNFIWFDYYKYSDPNYRKGLFNNIRKLRFDVAINPVFSRSLHSDFLMFIARASRKIGIDGDTCNIRNRWKRITDHFYNRLVNIPINFNFEFDKTKYFFELLLDKKILIEKPSIELASNFKLGKSDKQYLVVFPGASDNRRKWPSEKFAEVIQNLLSHTSLDIILSGGIGDQEIAQDIIEKVASERIINWVGKTGLIELICLIRGACLVVSNETSAVHISSALNVPSICILGGGHFERFVPYSGESETTPIPIFHKMECYGCNWRCKYVLENNQCYPCINSINVEMVWLLIEKVLRLEHIIDL